MRLLILGASDSEGTLLANFADSWREKLRTRLPALLGEDVEVLHRRFYVHLPGANEYLERALSEDDPDFVIFGATGYSFTTASAGNRLRRLIGKRFGDWAERQAARFDRLTEREIGSPVERVNYAAHWLVGHTVGREAVASHDDVLQSYTEAIERLARAENLDAIIMGTTYSGPRIQRRLPGIHRTVDRFNQEIRRLAESRRFGWLDRQAIISGLPRDTSRPDQLHTGPEIHAAYAEALIAQIVARRTAGEATGTRAGATEG